MRTLICTLLISILGFVSVNSFAQDTTVRVLAMRASDVSPFLVDLELNAMAQGWPSGGPTLTILPERPVLPFTLNGNGSTSLDTLTPQHPSIPGSGTHAGSSMIAAARDGNGADIVIVFNKMTSACGQTRLGWTTNTFFPNAQGLDLKASEFSHLALVSTNQSTCSALTLDYTATAHEVGHMHGVVHFNENNGLNPDSRGRVSFINIMPPPEVELLTIGTFVSACHEFHPTCEYVKFYSAVAGADAKATMNFTGPSVANYRVTKTGVGGGGGGDGGCNLSLPFGLNSSLLSVCAPQAGSLWNVSWLDACPSVSDFYAISYQLPNGTKYTLPDRIYGLSTPVQVVGVSAAVSVHSCIDLGGPITPVCAESIETTPVVDLCVGGGF